jgi:hypothetical protein
MKRIGVIMIWIVGALVLIGMINFTPMVSLKTPGMQAYESHGITVFAEREDEEEVEKIAGRIAESSARVAGSLGDADTEKIDVIIYPTSAALKRKTIGLVGMLLLPDWYIGKNTSDHVLITSPAKPGPQHTRESIEQAAVHEFVHVLTDRRNKTMGYWLKEGFALYLADQRPSIEAIRAERDITWEEYSKPNAIQFAEVGGYTLAFTLLQYLEEEYGWDTVLKFLEPENTFLSVTGKEKREVFEEWKNWLGSV